MVPSSAPPLLAFVQLCDLSFGRPIVPKFTVAANKGNRILTTATVYTK